MMRVVLSLICRGTLICLLLMPEQIGAQQSTDKFRNVFSQSLIKKGRDTLQIIPDSSRKTQADRFFDRLEQNAAKHYWSRTLHNIVVVPSDRRPLKDTLRTEESGALFNPYEGRVIREIRFNRLEVLGPSMNDTSENAPYWMQRTTNRLHMYTSPYVLKNHLLLHSGDKVIPEDIADNERLLREIPSIEDARIELIPVGTDSVDILITTKDLLAKAFNLEIEGPGKGKLELWDQNLFGTGYSLKHTLLWNSRHSPLFGYEGDVILKNLFGSFVDAEMDYLTSYKTNSYNIKIEREFFTPQVKYAGGINLIHLDTRKAVWMGDTLLGPDKIGQHAMSFWLGRSFPVQTQNWFTKNRTSIVLAGSIDVERFPDRPPEVAPGILWNYQNRTLLMGSLSFAAQSFYRSNLIYSFGRTEDIPYGSLLKFLGGVEWNEFFTRLYAGFGFSKGNYVGNIGYLYQEFDMGGFLRQRQLEQGLLSYNAEGFSNLLVFRRFYFRHFIKVRYTYGINRNPDEYVTLNGMDAITGFDTPYVRGTHKLVLKEESVVFTPYYIYGFRPALFGYVDVGWLGSEEKLIFNCDFYSGIGAGVRIRNERLVFNTFQLGVTYYPVQPPGINPFMFFASIEARLKFPNFYVKKPEPLSFN